MNYLSGENRRGMPPSIEELQWDFGSASMEALYPTPRFGPGCSA